VNSFLPIDVMPTKIQKIEATNSSTFTICAKLQIKETKPLDLQLLTKTTHTMYPQATTLLEQSIFFDERLLEIYI